MAPIRHTLRVVLGVGLTILGIAGLLLPIMPGWIFLIPGLLILADYFPPIGRLVNYFRAKFKDAEEGFRKSRERDEPESTVDGSAVSDSGNQPERRQEP